ncbi:13271_t:CDS:2 [Gigaspora margarita]|uniref:13271_t:CDS:1 n=1 Tax=Gigaspora margarita TaxID=4874 RepID=A0ABN7UHI0_GIGMA|nr:13271_t:CDS:2 [Gigaspora margarita]
MQTFQTGVYYQQNKIAIHSLTKKLQDIKKRLEELLKSQHT